MNRDKPLNSMQNMLKISREYTHNYVKIKIYQFTSRLNTNDFVDSDYISIIIKKQYKGVTTYENSFPSLQVFGFFQTLEKLNEKLYQVKID